MSKDPWIEYSAQIERLRQNEQAFALATVVKVHGSASARVGSKAIFNHAGKNIFGWVGGGCAERFVGEQAIEAIKEKNGRVILADLDDEIFGLGVACGGKMEVFIDPITPMEKVRLPRSPQLTSFAETFADGYGFTILWEEVGDELINPAEFFSILATVLAKQRGRSGLPLRHIKDLPMAYGQMAPTSKIVATILGRGRIAEALLRHFAAVGWSARAVALDEFDGSFLVGGVVIVASHSARDREMVAEALKQKSAYVGMVGSRKRALELNEHLKMTSQEASFAPLFLPAGFDIDAKNPDEIALSITAEILREMKGAS